MSNVSQRVPRATGLLVIEVRNSNPNGDPDQDSDPRHRGHDKRGIISGVSFKRKVRDLVQDKGGPVWEGLADRLSLANRGGEFQILESRGRDRKTIDAEIKNKTFQGNYWDARLFGNTFLEKEGEDSIRTGVAQFAIGISVAPIRIERMTNTNKSGVQEGKDRGMAPLAYRVVEHGVYTMPFFINPTAAERSGCTGEDVDLLLALIPYAYAHTASHSRPSVEVRHAWYAEHGSRLGSCSDFAIIDALTPRKKEDPQSASTCWGDYEVPAGLPAALADKVVLRDLTVCG